MKPVASKSLFAPIERHEDFVRTFPLDMAESDHLKNLLDFVAAGAHPVTQVTFAFAQPAYAPLAAELFERPVAYNQPWTGFSFPADAVDAPLRHTDPNTYQEALLICQCELEKITQSIQEIAFALGGADIANFRRAFKRREGVAPSGFRVESRV